MGILNGCDIKRKRVKLAINAVVDVSFSSNTKYSPTFNLFYWHFFFIIITE